MRITANGCGGGRGRGRVRVGEGGWEELDSVPKKTWPSFIFFFKVMDIFLLS
jgi:hypothetical protein